MMYAVEMTSGGMKHIPRFMTIDSRVQDYSLNNLRDFSDGITEETVCETRS
jgi:hypothetical protein